MDRRELGQLAAGMPCLLGGYFFSGGCECLLVCGVGMQDQNWLRPLAKASQPNGPRGPGLVSLARPPGDRMEWCGDDE